jgi:ferritin-like metal-binding protein YciE
MLTATELQQWVGHVAQDPYGEPLGTITELMSDRESGAPEWLVVSDGDSSRGTLVPLEGAVPTGQRIRVVPTAAAVRSGPQVALGEELDIESKRRAAEHYGLNVDTEASPSGLLRPRAHAHAEFEVEPQAGAPPSAPSPTQRRQIVEGLRAAHAMEQASLKLLAAMRWRMEDEELVHDVAFHHKATNRHAERLRERLDELDEPRGRPYDWAGNTLAYVQAQLGRFRTQPDPGDVRAAHAFEEREIEAYERLERLALEAGDERTAAVCRSNLADEVAMRSTLEQSRLWADPGPRRDQPSPFAAPPELAEMAPES